MIKKNKKNYQPRHVKAIVPPAQNELHRAASGLYMDEQKPDTIAEAAEEIGANQDEAAREKVASTKPAAKAEEPAAKDRAKQSPKAKKREKPEKEEIASGSGDEAPIEIAVTEASSIDESEDEAFRADSAGKSRKKKNWKKILIIAVTIPLVLIIGLVSTFFIMREIGRQSIQNKKPVEIVLPSEDESGNPIELGDKYGRIINYEGTSYIYNNDIITLTFIGADNGHKDKTAADSTDEMRMADAIYVFAIDTKTDKVKVLNISRDLMTDVDIYSVNGTLIRTEETQIAYSNAYHAAGKSGGDNTVKSVSRLLFGLPLENYFELNLGGVSTLNDAVGGVTVTSSLAFKSPEDKRMINEGDVVTLHGKEAEVYARRRDIKELDSNNKRMQRQQEYIMAFLSSIVPAAKKDLSIIPNLYNAIKDNSDTSLNASELVYIASYAATNLKSLSDVQFYKFKGNITAGKNAEMRVTTEEVLRTMLDVFYKPLETTATDASGNPVVITLPAAETQPGSENPSAPPQPSVKPTEAEPQPSSETVAA